MSVHIPICHVSTVHPANDVRIFYRECGYLVQSGFDVHLVVSAESDSLKNNVNIHALSKVNSRISRILFQPWRAMLGALKTRARLYHYHDPELIFVGFILRWVFQKKVVFDVHESIARHLSSKPYFSFGTGRIVSFFYSIAEKVLLCGQEIVVANKSVKKDYPKRAFLVQNFPVLSDSFVKKEYEQEMPCLVYLGAVEDGRGAWIYLELAKKLKEAGRRFKLTIIGQYNPKLGNQMLDYLLENKLQDNVDITGRMEWAKAMEIVSKSSIGLCILKPEPNYTSCLATKILEYMMAAVPVLASDFDTWRPFIIDTGSGKMVDPGNGDQIFSTCCQMLDDQDSLKEMGRAGRKAVEDRYNWDSEFVNLLECYNKCLN